jgi:hypothetical protein
MSLTAIGSSRAVRPESQPARIAVDVALSVGTGLVADQISRSGLRSGRVSGVLLGLVGGAAFKGVAEGSLAVGRNLAKGQDWSTGLSGSVQEGLRTGLIDSGVSIAARPLHGALTKALPRIGQVGIAGLSGGILGSAAGSLDRATDGNTWTKGTAAGLQQVKSAALQGAIGGLVIGGVTGHLANYLHQRAATRAITIEPANANGAVRGGLKQFKALDRVQGSDVAGGTQPSFVLDMQSPELTKLRSAAQAIGDDATLSTQQKIDKVADLVNGNLKFASVKTPEYRVPYDKVNAMFKGKEAPLSEYLKAGVADCRGFAALNQVLLQEAKVPSYFTYIQEFKNGKYIWDHAINVRFEGKQPIVVDALFRKQFGGVPLQQMLTTGKEGVRFQPHPDLPFVYTDPSHNVRSLPGALAAMPRLWAAKAGLVAGQAHRQ